MFKSCFGTILVGVLMFIFVIGIIILLAYGLSYVLEYIPCEVLVYIETGVLLGIFMLVGYLLFVPATSPIIDLFKKNKVAAKKK